MDVPLSTSFHSFPLSSIRTQELLNYKWTSLCLVFRLSNRLYLTIQAIFYIVTLQDEWELAFLGR